MTPSSGELIVIHNHVNRMLGMAAATLKRLVPGQTDHEPERALEGFSQCLREDLEAAPEDALPDARLVQSFDLGTLETAVLWMAAAPYLDPGIRDLIARANDNLLRDWMEPALCIRAFCRTPGQRLEALKVFLPNGNLRTAELLNLEARDARPNPLFHELVPCEPLAAYLCGERALSPSAMHYATLLESDLRLSHIPHSSTDAELTRLLGHFFTRRPFHELTRGHRTFGHPKGIAVLIQGARGSGRYTLLKAIAGELGRRLVAINGRLLAHASVSEATRVLRALMLEGELYGDIVCIRDADALVKPGKPHASVLTEALQRRHTALVLCIAGEDELDPFLESVIVTRNKLTASPSAAELGLQWQLNLPESGTEVQDVSFKQLAETINLSPLQMRKANTLSYLLGHLGKDEASVVLDAPLLLRSARAQISRTIGSLAQVVEPELTLKDLVLEEDTFEIVREIISAARHRRLVLKDWGLGRRIRRGTGIVALFDGEPGTGKTHAAEVIAGELGLSLVRVNIASIVDKYIGETEKHLTHLFENVRSDLSVLLFDEADSLFAKRSTSAEKSNDRYSNMNINVLLQLIERYEGVTVLTTNIKKAIDPAFERRITYKLHFKMPEQEEREHIWRYLLPEDVQTGEDIDYAWLSEVQLSGGEIKNAILLACYRATHLGTLVDNDILFDTAQREAAAAGRVVRREF